MPVRNSDNLQRLSVVPDALWKRPETYQKERFAHFFQWDQYQSSALANVMPVTLMSAIGIVGNPFLITNGTAVWRGEQLYRMLVNAIRAADWAATIQMAGVIGHYFGDLSQPMHVTSDYDGQSIGRRGIHAYFESTLIDRQNPVELHDRVWRAANHSEGDSNSIQKEFTIPSGVQVIEIATNEAKSSLTRLPDLLGAFSASGVVDDIELANLAVTSLAEGASTLSAIWDRAAAEAFTGNVIPTGIRAVADPSWIPVEIVPAEN